MSLFDDEAYRPPARANGMRFAPTTTAGRVDEVTALFLRSGGDLRPWPSWYSQYLILSVS